MTIGRHSPEAESLLGQLVASLSAIIRSALTDHLRNAYRSGRPDGPRSIPCVAWAYRATSTRKEPSARSSPTTRRRTSACPAIRRSPSTARRNPICSAMCRIPKARRWWTRVSVIFCEVRKTPTKRGRNSRRNSTVASGLRRCEMWISARGRISPKRSCTTAIQEPQRSGPFLQYAGHPAEMRRGLAGGESVMLAGSGGRREHQFELLRSRCQRRTRG